MEPGKDTFRRYAKAYLNSDINRKAVSNLAIANLLSLDSLKKARNILLYSSKDNEVDTVYLTKHLLSQKKNIYFPFISSIDIGKIEKFSDLLPSEFGIMLPKDLLNGIVQLDLIIIPGLMFDQRGYRLGYGSGWYDRLLAQYTGAKNAIKIGICFDEMLVKKLPNENHDIPVDLVVSDKKIHLVI